MDDRQVINYRQFVFLVGVTLVTGLLVNLPREITLFAGADSWFTLIIPIWYALMMCYVFYKLSSRFPGKHLFEIVFELAGKWAGGSINAILLLYFWMILVRDLRGFSQFVTSILLPKTPEEIVLMLLLLVILFYGRTSVEVTARVNDIVFPLFLVMMIMLPLALSNEFSFGRVAPVLTLHVTSLWNSNFLFLGWYGDLIVAGAFLHTIANAKQIHAAMRNGVVLSVFLLTALIFIEISVLGVKITGRSMFPSYTLVQQIHLTDFLDRLEIFAISLWFPIFIIKQIFTYLALLIGISSFNKSRDYRIYNRTVIWFVLITGMLAFRNITEVFAFSVYSSIIIVLATQPPLFILLLLLMKIRKNKRSVSPTAPQSATNENGPDPQQQPSFVQQIRLQTWMNWSHGLLLASVAFVAAGLLFSKDYYVIGIISGIGYGICLFAAMITTYMEVRKTAQ